MRVLTSVGLAVSCYVLLSWQAQAQQRGRGEGHRPPTGAGFSLAPGGAWTNQPSAWAGEENETFEARILLQPTDSAPTNAIAFARLEAETQNGAQTATLSLGAFGLPDGDYTVSAVRASDQSSVTLGQFTASSSGNVAAGGNEGGDSGEGSDHGGGPQGACPQNGAGPAPARFDAQLPTDLDPTDVAQIVIADVNGTAMLVGDVSSSSSQLGYQMTVNVTAGPGAPRASGQALLRRTAIRGKAASHVSVTLSSVPANARLNVQVNGRYVGQVTSGRRGYVVLKDLAVQSSSVRSVGVSDARGRTVAAARF